jgi:hypothetical protein
LATKNNDTSLHFMLNDEHFYDKIFKVFNGIFPGIYRLRVLEESGQFRLLPRIFEADPNGIVYIGTSAEVPFRSASLKKSVSAAYRRIDPNKYGSLNYVDTDCHQTGKKILRIPKFVEIFPFELLCMTFAKHEPGTTDLDVPDYGHFGLEGELLSKYELQFGERPALNA